MSPQDSQMLNDFLGQLVQARGIQKDPEADALIQRAVAQQPDATYLLVQRALLLEQALNNAKAQVASLESQLDAQRAGQQGGGGKFLDPNAWGNSGASRPAQAPQSYQRDVQAQYQNPPPYYQQAPLQSGFLRGGLGGLGGGLGGTLGSIAATAAGVAAGGFLFQGLENMFSHHGGGNNRLLGDSDAGSGNNLFSDQSGSSLADQAGLGDVGQSLDNGGVFQDSGSQGLFDSSVDTDAPDTSGGFFDGDGSDEGLFS